MFDNRANKNYTLTQFLGFFLSKLGRNLQLRSRDEIIWIYTGQQYQKNWSIKNIQLKSVLI